MSQARLTRIHRPNRVDQCTEGGRRDTPQGGRASGCLVISWTRCAAPWAVVSFVGVDQSITLPCIQNLQRARRPVHIRKLYAQQPSACRHAATDCPLRRRAPEGSSLPSEAPGGPVHLRVRFSAHRCVGRAPVDRQLVIAYHGAAEMISPRESNPARCQNGSCERSPSCHGC